MQTKFTFDIFEKNEDIQCEVADCGDRCVNDVIQLNVNFEEYEEYLLLLALYNSTFAHLSFNKLTEGTCKTLLNINKYPFSKIFNSEYIRNIENKINKVKEIKDLIKTKINNDTYLSFSYKEINQMPEVITILKETAKDIKTKIKNYLKNKKINQLKVNNITKKYHEFLKVLGITIPHPQLFNNLIANFIT